MVCSKKKVIPIREREKEGSRQKERKQGIEKVEVDMSKKMRR